MTKSSKLLDFGTSKALLSTSGKRLLGRSNVTSEKVAAAPLATQSTAIVNGASPARVPFEIKHWVNGRLRVAVPRVARDKEYAERLQYRVAVIGFATNVRVTPSSQSLVVEYDAKQHAEPDVLNWVTTAIQDADQPDPMLELMPKQEEGEFKINYVKRLALPGAALAMGLGTLVGIAVPPLLLGGTVIAAAIPSFRRAWEGIRDEKKLNVDFLDSTAIIALTATSMFFPPALMVSLIESGEIIRDLTARRTARASLDLLDALGKTARVERDGVEIEIPVQDLAVGDIVCVYPGDQIPVDGVVLSGVGLVDQQKLTGESIPITREEGQDVLAATLVVDGTMRIKAERVGENTRAGVVVSLMKAAPVHDTRMEDYARKVGDRIVIPTLALGGAVTLVTGSIIAGISVITLDIGTGVRVSVPTAILASLTFAARNGILIRSGRALEQLASIDTVVFDKTGTLTQGRAGVTAIYTQHAGVDRTEVLQLAASAEAGLTHPVAEAIIRHAREQEVPTKECEAWEFRVGQGVAATIDGRELYVGSHRMMKNLGVDTDHINAMYPEIESSAASQVFVAEGNELLGVILYKDPARPESPGVIEHLIDLGITPYMLSGDIRTVANAVAAELGIQPEHVYAEAFPERKVEVVKQLQESGKTIAFVGDGINDSAALAHASVSVSFAGATDMARETADIVLMDDDLSSLILAIRIAKMSMQVVKQNAGIVVGPNLSAMVWAALVGLNPVAAVVINNGSAIAAEMNGFRPLMGPPGWEKLMAERAEAAHGAKTAAEPPTVFVPVTPVTAEGSNGKAAANGATPTVPTTDGADGHNGNGNGHSNGHANGNGKASDLAQTEVVAATPAPKRTRKSKSANSAEVTNGANGHTNGHNGNGNGHANGNGNGHTGNGHADAAELAQTEVIAAAPAPKRTRKSKSANGANGSAAEPIAEDVPVLKIVGKGNGRAKRANGSMHETETRSVLTVLEQAPQTNGFDGSQNGEALSLATDETKE
ncbi:MAG: heavy metal translocating P-type ATPase [Anaerolineae bacterium]